MTASRELNRRHHFIAIGDELRAARRSVDDLYLATRQAISATVASDDEAREEHERAKGHYAEALASLRLVDVEVEKLRKEMP